MSANTSATNPSTRLAKARLVVDRVLEEIRAQTDLARRVVTRDLGFEPRAGMLRAILHVARDSATAGARFELPRQLLALHVLVGRELTELLDSPRLDPRRLREGGRRLGELLQGLHELERELIELLAAAEEGDRAFIGEVADAMALADSRLIAGAVLAPRLALLTEASGSGDMRTAVPALTVEDAGMLARATGKGPDEAPECRASVNAVALRTLIEEDLERLESLDDKPEQEGWVRSRRAVLDRLRRDALAYHAIDERLREQQDAAIAAGLDVFAAEIARVKSELFTAHLKTLPVVRSPV